MACSIGISASLMSPSHGATKPEAGSSPLSSSKLEELAGDEGACLLEPDEMSLREQELSVVSYRRDGGISKP